MSPSRTGSCQTLGHYTDGNAMLARHTKGRRQDIGMHRARYICCASDLYAECSSERCLKGWRTWRRPGLSSGLTSGQAVPLNPRTCFAGARQEQAGSAASKEREAAERAEAALKVDFVKAFVRHRAQRKHAQGSQYVMLLPLHQPIRAICTMQTSISTQTSCEYCSSSDRVALRQEHSIRRKIFVARRPPTKGPLWQSRFRVTTRPQKRPSVSAQQIQTATSTAQKAEDVHQVSLKTSEARKSIRFTQTKDGRIVIEAVAIGSEAQQVTHPTGLSDPVLLEGKETTGSI